MTAISMQGRFVTTSDIHQIVDQVIHMDVAQERQALERLSKANGELTGSTIGFLHGGEFHSIYPSKVQASVRNKRPPHPDLLPEVRDYVAMKKRLSDDRNRLTAGLSLILRPCQNPQDVRDALPEIMKDEWPPIKELTRTRPEGWTIRQQPLLADQMNITLDLARSYVTSRLFY